MPHLHIASFKAPVFPATADGVTFHYIADNTEHGDEKLVAASVEDKSFFLLLKDLPGKTLLKADKISRPSPTHFVKRALIAYARKHDLRSSVHDDSPSPRKCSAAFRYLVP